jgi:hypothetical protein
MEGVSAVPGSGAASCLAGETEGASISGRKIALRAALSSGVATVSLPVSSFCLRFAMALVLD